MRLSDIIFCYSLSAAFWLVTSLSDAQTSLGGRGTVPDAGRFDVNHPIKNKFARAGVVGGIPDPNSTRTKAWLSPGDNIQAAINNGGPGLVYLNSGNYNLHQPLVMRDGVVLRGVHEQDTVLSVKMKSTSKVFAVQFSSNTTYAGLENLTISYDAVSQQPIDRSGLDNGGYYGAAFQNNPHGHNDLYVGSVGIWGSNNWLDSVSIQQSGTDPILVQGNHNTVRNSYIDQAYNKGGGGNGYVDIRGDRNLFTNNTVRRIRHLAVQQGAQYNVLFDNYIEGDVNFHNGDGGQNLVEKNEVYKPSWHGWTVFGTGAPEYGHAPPGFGNVIFDNDTWDHAQNYSPASVWNKTYTFSTYGEPTETNWAFPNYNTYYPTKVIPDRWSAGDIGSDSNGGFIYETNGQWTVQAAGADVWGSSDSFYYTWQPLHGDGEIVADVISQQDTHDWAKAGLMIRESLDADSKHAQISLSPENGAVFQFRPSTGGGSQSVSANNGQIAPARLKITRAADTLTGYVWQNNQWSLVGSTDVSMWEEAYIGFFATSHDAANFSEVRFDNVDVSALDNASVFADDFNGPGGTLIHGKASEIGLGWTEPSGTGLTTSGGALDTTGSARVIFGQFAHTLSPGETLRLSFASEQTPLGNLFTSGFAGVSLFDLDGNELVFIGDPAGGTSWALVGTGISAPDFLSGISDEAVTVDFLYGFDTGEYQFLLDGNVVESGVTTAGYEFDSLRIKNNFGSDIRIRNVDVAFIVPGDVAIVVPEPTSVQMLTAAIILITGGYLLRRKQLARRSKARPGRRCQDGIRERNGGRAHILGSLQNIQVKRG